MAKTINNPRIYTQQLLNDLLTPTIDFKDLKMEEVNALLEKIVSEKQRILYSEFTKQILSDNQLFKDDSDDAIFYQPNEIISVNIQRMISFLNDKDEDKQKEIEILIKLYDHVSLANIQAKSLIDSSRSINTTKDKLDDIDKTRDGMLDNMRKLKENLKSEIAADMISLVGLFTALSFIVFGGFSLINSITNIITEIPFYYSVFLISLISLILFNLILLFIYMVDNMITNNKISNKNKSFYISLLCIVNSILLIFLIISYRNIKTNNEMSSLSNIYYTIKEN